MRFLSGRGITLTHAFLDDETFISVPSVSVTVWREGDTAPVATATGVALQNSWTITLAPLPVGVYSSQWSADGYTDTVPFEVVGGFLFTVPEFRDADPDMTVARFPANDVRRYREVVESEFERITSRSFTPRAKRVRLTGWDGRAQWLGLFDVRGLVSVSVDGVPLTDTSGWVVSPTGFLEPSVGVPGASSVVLTVSYGFDAVPDDVKRAGMLRTRYLMAAENTGIPDRATSFVSAEGGQFSLATPGMGGWETGIPDVDATLKRYRYDILQSVVGIG